MIAAIADTHTIIWYLAADPRLSPTALSFINDAAQNGNEIGISGITLIEMVYLVEKGRIPAQYFSLLANELDSDGSVLIEIPINSQVARALSLVNVSQVPDMPDRIIAATAVHLNVSVISRDRKIQLSTISTIW